LSVLRPRAGRILASLNTKQTMLFSYNHDLNLDIFLRYFFQIVWSKTLNFVIIWLHWYGSSKTYFDQGEWSMYLVPDKLCKFNFLILVLYHWYMTFWLSNTVLKYMYLHGFCYFLLFIFVPCWLVGFWIFKWCKTDKNIAIA
jgi:hypothetical protein